MTIQMQCCGICMLLVLLLFYARHKRTNLLTEQVFRLVICTALLCLVLDVSSILVINAAFDPDYPRAPMLLADLMGKAYLVSLTAIGLVTLLYVCAGVYYDRPALLRRRAFTYGALELAALVSVFLLPIGYDFDEAGVVTNTSGPSVYAAYCFIGLYLALIVIHLVRHRSRLSRPHLAAVTVWMALWVGAFVAHILDHSLLLAGFACSVGILILYLALENPEGNLDKTTGLFTPSVLNSYLRQKYSVGENFSALLLLFDGPIDQGVGHDSAENIRQDLCRFVESHHSWIAFRQSENRIFFVFDSPRDAREARSKVNRYMASRWPNAELTAVKLHWILVPDARMVDSHAALLYLTRYFSHRHYFQDDLLEIDQRLIDEAQKSLKVEGLLDAAIKNDAIEIFYQPIYSTRERRITSAEALVRIRDENGALVPPGLFIPIAESNGMILALGNLIFEHVCRFIKYHPLDELGLSYIEVNLSMVQCANADLAVDFIGIMRRFNISPQHINLEITESASTSTKKALLRNMDLLIDYGTSFSLDDFGTGQSNLNYIIDLPVKIAKFDRTMVQSYFSNPRGKHVMNAAIRMIHDMGLSIVSEGVETLEELQVIEDLGVEYIQGFYFSKPLSESDFLEYLRHFQPPEEKASAS